MHLISPEDLRICYLISIANISIVKQRLSIYSGFGCLHRIPAEAQTYLYRDNWVVGIHSFKRGKWLTVLMHFLFMLWHYLGKYWFKFLPYLLKFIVRHVSPFSKVKYVRYFLFLFNKLCKLNFLFTFLSIWAFMSPPMIKTLSLGIPQTREDKLL